MTTQTIEANRIICQFMGWVIQPGMEAEKDPCYTMGFNIAFVSHMKFHTSWDWLHPAWQKFRGTILTDRSNIHALQEKVSEIDKAVIYEDTPARAAELLADAINWLNSINDKNK